MGCNWFLTFHDSVIETGNQNCYLQFLSLLLKKDFHNSERKYCRISASEVIDRLSRIGYSTKSCMDSINEIKKQTLRKEEILFWGEDFQYLLSDDAFWLYLKKLDMKILSLIWMKRIESEELDVNEKKIFQIMTNSYPEEYIEPYFDQNINYFILAMLGLENDVFELDVSEVIEWGYWKSEDFLEDAYNQQLKLFDKKALIRYSTIDLEEDEKHEFKEVNKNRIIQSIKNYAEKYVISFINSKGGEIIWGVSDKRIIVGFYADETIRDTIRKTIASIINNIIPQIDPKMYSICFMSIIENGTIDPNLVCVRLKIRKGKIIYSSPSNKVWIRQNGVSIEVKEKIDA